MTTRATRHEQLRLGFAVTCHTGFWQNKRDTEMQERRGMTGMVVQLECNGMTHIKYQVSVIS